MTRTLYVWLRGFCLMLCVIAAIVGNLVAQRLAQGQALDWVRQLGTDGRDTSTSVSVDDLGNVYISGYTVGSLGGPRAGEWDAFVSKYNAAGSLQWTGQLGTERTERSYGVSADGLGNVYISGNTSGSLGAPNPGRYSNAFVSKYDAVGAVQWTRQLGTNSFDTSYGVSADGLGNIYISGSTAGSLGGRNAGDRDAFVSKFDAAGTLLWTRQLGTNGSDESYGVSADRLGNVYISGYTSGSLNGPNAGDHDAFISKYDAAGALQWTRQLGTPYADESRSVSADGLGNAYISGFTNGSLGGPNSGRSDAFLSKFDTAGTLLWTQQPGTTAFDASYGVSADSLGNVYISGSTTGDLEFGGPPNAGGYADAFVTMFNADGTFQWTRQFGTPLTDANLGVSADGLGNVYTSGETFGSLVGGPHLNSNDAFLAKFGVPEPASASLLAITLALLPARRRAASRK